MSVVQGNLGRPAELRFGRVLVMKGLLPTARDCNAGHKENLEATWQHRPTEHK